MIVPNSFMILSIFRYKVCTFPTTKGESISNRPDPITPALTPNTFCTSFSHCERNANVCVTISVFCWSLFAIANAVKVFPQLTQAFIIQLSSTSSYTACCESRKVNLKSKGSTGMSFLLSTIS